MGIESGGEERPSPQAVGKVSGHMPRLVRFAVDKLRYARRIDAFIEQAQSAIRLIQPTRRSRTAQMRNFSAASRSCSLESRSCVSQHRHASSGTVLLARFTRRLESAGVDPGTFDTRGSTHEMARGRSRSRARRPQGGIRCGLK